MKKNGFTLIELLATLVILGIVITIALQSYFVLEKDNDTSKYSYYLELMETGADLYLESKKDTMENGACLSVKYQTLVRKNLVKEEDVVCDGSLLLRRTGKKFEYDDNLLSCKAKGSGKVLKEKSETVEDSCVAVQDTDIYYIKYDANGGEGAPAGQTKTHDLAIVIPETEPTRTGYTFEGWSASPTATTASYQPGEEFNENGDITLYAVWKLITYKITYNASGGSGAPGQQIKTFDQTLQLSTTEPTRVGYLFRGWATSASGGVAYVAGANYTANSDATLYAVWEHHVKVVYSPTKGVNLLGNSWSVDRWSWADGSKYAKFEILSNCVHVRGKFKNGYGGGITVTSISFNTTGFPYIYIQAQTGSYTNSVRINDSEVIGNNVNGVKRIRLNGKTSVNIGLTAYADAAGTGDTKLYKVVLSSDPNLSLSGY